ncbi:MAG: hypothetical protein JW834_00315 [Candidatus Diapherotrites archaeon]|nr:hypothetical protein [Candidatus Diapherotrites archaeon]
MERRIPERLVSDKRDVERVVNRTDKLMASVPRMRFFRSTRIQALEKIMASHAEVRWLLVELANGRLKKMSVESLLKGAKLELRHASFLERGKRQWFSSQKRLFENILGLSTSEGRSDNHQLSVEAYPLKQELAFREAEIKRIQYHIDKLR